jgi:uncharacterized membrane-anchored protein YhcB (DUF1043 family)
MTGAVTYEQVQWFMAEIVVVASLLIGIWKVVAGRMEGIRTEARASVEALEEELAKATSELGAFKLQVAQEYARTGYIKDVEVRLTESMGALTREIHSMNSRIDKVLTTLVEQQQPQRKPSRQ